MASQNFCQGQNSQHIQLDKEKLLLSALDSACEQLEGLMKTTDDPQISLQPLVAILSPLPSLTRIADKKESGADWDPWSSTALGEVLMKGSMAIRQLTQRREEARVSGNHPAE